MNYEFLTPKNMVAYPSTGIALTIAGFTIFEFGIDLGFGEAILVLLGFGILVDWHE